LRTKRSNTIGLVIPNIDNPFFSAIAKSIAVEAQAINYSIIFSDSQEKQKLEIDAIQVLISRNVDGLIVLPIGDTNKHLMNIVDNGVPIVLADRSFPAMNCPQVISDNYRGAVDAVTYLIEKGHQQIACIQGNKTTSVNNERVQAYKETLQKNNLPFNQSYLVGDKFSIKNGYISMKLLMNTNPRPTAVFTLSNLTSLGAMQAILEDNKKIPDDYSIITFDNDQPYSNFLKTPLTTIAQQTEEIGQIAFKLLLDEIQRVKENTGQKKSTTIKLPTRLVVRESVKDIRNS
jgi:LacI family transcriptional regulator